MPVSRKDKLLMLRSAISASARKITMDVDTLRMSEATRSVKQFMVADIGRLANTILLHLEELDCHLEALYSEDENEDTEHPF